MNAHTSLSVYTPWSVPFTKSYIVNRLLRVTNEAISRQFLAVMENASLPSDVWNNSTVPSEDNSISLYLYQFRDLALEVIHVIMGTVGVLDNLFVIITFALFIKITDKVMAILMRRPIRE